MGSTGNIEKKLDRIMVTIWLLKFMKGKRQLYFYFYILNGSRLIKEIRKDNRNQVSFWLYNSMFSL